MGGETVIVTGCSGYIGTVLCNFLKAQGHKVIGFDLEENPLLDIDQLHLTCISSRTLAETAIDNNVTKIFHLAAFVDVRESVEQPWLYYSNNTGNTAKMIGNLADVDWKGHLIFSSTAGVYGDPVSEGVHEYSPVVPTNPYGHSKLICEQLLKDTSELRDIKVTVFRYFNVAGADDLYGDHLTSNHIIQKLCKAAYARSVFYINGDQYPTKDGTCVRDYVHVNDICRAHMFAAFVRPHTTKFEVYNLGTGVGFTNKEVAAAFSVFTGVEIAVKIKDARPGDSAVLIARPTKFTFTTGFRYLHSSLESIITSSWNSYTMRIQNGI